MRKFFVKSTNKEVKIGDTVTLEFVTDTPFGVITATKTLKVTSETLKTLIQDNKVIEKEVKPDHNLIVATAINNLATKFECRDGDMLEILHTIKKVNPWASLQLFLKEVAIILDMQYLNHISTSEQFYCISPQDCKIHKINKESIKIFQYAPLFRTIDDAGIAQKAITIFLSL